MKPLFRVRPKWWLWWSPKAWRACRLIERLLDYELRHGRVAGALATYVWKGSAFRRALGRR